MRFHPILLFLLFLLNLIANAQDRVAAALDSLPSAKNIDQVAISPDATQVAYIVEGELSVASLATGQSHRINPEQKAVRDVSWAADSRRLVWLNDLPGDVPAAQL